MRKILSKSLLVINGQESSFFSEGVPNVLLEHSWMVWWWVHSSPLLTSGSSQKETVTGTAGNDPVLAQKVTGELVVHASLV